MTTESTAARDTGFAIWDPFAPQASPAPDGRRLSAAQLARLGTLLDHAVAVFAETGFGHATVRMIGERAGRAPSGLYYYVQSKEHALFLIACRGYWRLHARIDDVVATCSEPEACLRAAVRAHVDYQLRHYDEFLVLFRDLDALPEPARAYIDGLRTGYVSKMRDVVCALVGADDAARRRDEARWLRLTLYLFGMVHWPLFGRRRYRTDYWAGVDADAFAREVTDLFLDGVRGRRGARSQA